MSKLIALAALSSAPNALLSMPRADTDGPPAALFAQLNAAFHDFKDRHEARYSAIEAALDGALASQAANGTGMAVQAADPAYSKLFASYLRGGSSETELRAANGEGMRAQIQAAMTVGTPSEGGYLAPTEWDRQIRKRLAALSPMRRLATVVSTGVGAFSTVWSDGAWVTGWVGEQAARPATGSPTLSSLEFAAGEIYANVPITQRLLDDAEIDAEQWLTEEIGEQFMREEGVAFINGNGVNKPFGLLSYITGGAADGRHPGGNLVTVNGGHASQVLADGLLTFAYSLPSPYRQGAAWLMNSTTAATISKLKTTNGDYVWRESLVVGQPASLLGYPVEIDETMPDVAANALPIAFGNFARGYLINDRMGTRILRDPYTNKPFVNFYATKRVGGGVLDPNAIRLLKIAA